MVVSDNGVTVLCEEQKRIARRAEQKADFRMTKGRLRGCG
jgi:hypothetical protein